MQKIILNDRRVEQKSTVDLIMEIDYLLTQSFKIIVESTENYVKKFKYL